jgi:hypothetical protein
MKNHLFVRRFLVPFLLAHLNPEYPVQSIFAFPQLFFVLHISSSAHASVVLLHACNKVNREIGELLTSKSRYYAV